MAAGKKNNVSILSGTPANGQNTANNPGQNAAPANTPTPAVPAVKATIDTFYKLITDHYGKNIRYNEMTSSPEYFDPLRRRWMRWADAQEAEARAYFETSYGLYSTQKLTDAFQIYFKDHKVNPLTALLEGLTWDGKPRVEQFLHDVMKCEDTPYVRECSRLIFAGAINRAYDPGCKFDDMIVLIGSQAAGKSTIVRWLNIDDVYFREIKTIDGQKGIEAIQGVWIGEVGELMAMTRVKEAEAVKAYITSQEDAYRPPWGRYIQTFPRRCIFVGTTNNPQFLSDKTGNRRFYPVTVGSKASDLYDNEETIREYIRQAWAEAVTLYKSGNLAPFAKKEVLEDIRKAQKDAMEDDWRVGAIEEYLAEQKKSASATVSVIELWHHALNNPEEVKPTRKDSIELTQIISNMPGWIKCPNPLRTGKWGRQIHYRKDNFAALH